MDRFEGVALCLQILNDGQLAFNHEKAAPRDDHRWVPLTARLQGGRNRLLQCIFSSSQHLRGVVDVPHGLPEELGILVLLHRLPPEVVQRGEEGGAGLPPRRLDHRVNVEARWWRRRGTAFLQRLHARLGGVLLDQCTVRHPRVPPAARREDRPFGGGRLPRRKVVKFRHPVGNLRHLCFLHEHLLRNNPAPWQQWRRLGLSEQLPACAHRDLEALTLRLKPAGVADQVLPDGLQ
mmetsp:Transcript_74943/g.223313  ORF Transcript_74943/g.223313 Transcript_74943/m.223313 type:complete len:235 (+) Transcript_74943:1102-1806(+)